MNALVFMPDPVLSRAAPKAEAGEFDVPALLRAAPVGFKALPLKAPILALPQGQAAVSDTQAAVATRQAHGVEQTLNTAVPGDSPQPATALAVPPQARDVPVPPAFLAQLEQRYRDGFEDGMAEGSRLALDAPGDGASRDVLLLLESISRALQPLLQPDEAATRFEPLKRLALHLAMELVRSELNVSPRVVQHLVQRSVDALQAGEQAPLTVELHPQDLSLLRLSLNDPALGLQPDAPLICRVNWREDPDLTRGSVRARSDVSTVEDLIQHRLASIIQDLHIQAYKWQQDEAQLQQALEPMRRTPGRQGAEPAQDEGVVDA